ncbi:hypothetical protein RFI_16409, partial [Reticulomyxa filosa]
GEKKKKKKKKKKFNQNKTKQNKIKASPRGIFEEIKVKAHEYLKSYKKMLDDCSSMYEIMYRNTYEKTMNEIRARFEQLQNAAQVQMADSKQESPQSKARLVVGMLDNYHQILAFESLKPNPNASSANVNPKQKDQVLQFSQMRQFLYDFIDQHLHSIVEQKQQSTIQRYNNVITQFEKKSQVVATN